MATFGGVVLYIFGWPDRNAMVSISENFTKWVAAATVFALSVAISHEYGYFSVVGPHFQTVATTYDYLVNALVWLPSATVAAGVILGFKDWITEPVALQTPRLPKVLIWIFVILISVSGTITFFLGGTFAYEIAYIFCVGIVYASMWAYAYHFYHLPWESYRVAIFVLIIITFSFAYGTMLAHQDLRKTGDVYFLKYKTSNIIRPVVLLRGFEKGLLVRDRVNDRVELVRWDELVSFSNFASPKAAPSLSCRMFGIVCRKTVAPPI